MRRGCSDGDESSVENLPNERTKEQTLHFSCCLNVNLRYLFYVMQNNINCDMYLTISLAQFTRSFTTHRTVAYAFVFSAMMRATVHRCRRRRRHKEQNTESHISNYKVVFVRHPIKWEECCIDATNQVLSAPFHSCLSFLNYM